jgi:hypothetical protein
MDTGGYRRIERPDSDSLWALAAALKRLSLGESCSGDSCGNRTFQRGISPTGDPRSGTVEQFRLAGGCHRGVFLFIALVCSRNCGGGRGLGDRVSSLAK